MILDPQSEGSEVLKYVGDLLSQMERLQEKAFTYRSYQKTFKVCPVKSLLCTSRAGPKHVTKMLHSLSVANLVLKQGLNIG